MWAVTLYLVGATIVYVWGITRAARADRHGLPRASWALVRAALWPWVGALWVKDKLDPRRGRRRR